MQAHRGVGGLPIGTNFLESGGVVFEKNQVFEKKKTVSKASKENKKPDPIHFQNDCFYQTGTTRHPMIKFLPLSRPHNNG